MKKALLSLTLVFALGTSLTSCKEKNNQTEETTTEETAAVPVQNTDSAEEMAAKAGEDEEDFASDSINEIDVTVPEAAH